MEEKYYEAYQSLNDDIIELKRKIEELEKKIEDLKNKQTVEYHFHYYYPNYPYQVQWSYKSPETTG
jgi:predicted RNase H-like nuclease (RuvC/YqgF family)